MMIMVTIMMFGADDGDCNKYNGACDDDDCDDYDDDGGEYFDCG